MRRQTIACVTSGARTVITRVMRSPARQEIWRVADLQETYVSRLGWRQSRQPRRESDYSGAASPQYVATMLAAGLLAQPAQPDHEPAHLHAPAALQTYLHFRRWETPTQSLEAKRIDWSLAADLYLFDPEGA